MVNVTHIPFIYLPPTSSNSRPLRVSATYCSHHQGTMITDGVNFGCQNFVFPLHQKTEDIQYYKMFGDSFLQFYVLCFN